MTSKESSCISSELQINKKTVKDLTGNRLIILKNWELVLQKVSDIQDYILITPFKEQNYFEKIPLIEHILNIKPFRVSPWLIKTINIDVKDWDVSKQTDDSYFYNNIDDLFQWILGLVPVEDEKWFHAIFKREQDKILSEIKYSNENKLRMNTKMNNSVIVYTEVEIVMKNWMIILLSTDEWLWNVFITYDNDIPKHSIIDRANNYYNALRKKWVNVTIDDNLKG